ncbi:MAG: CHRD domain-containing protein, partial [Pirellula sp.]
ISSTTVTRSIPAGFGGVTYSNLASLLLTVGSGANVVTVNSTAAGVVTNIATGAGDDSVVFGNGVSLNGGTVDGGANNDTIDYSPYATSVAVNLGANATGGAFTASLNGFQENPGNASTATGTSTFVFNSVSKTLDIHAVISTFSPGLVTGYHIHRAAVGVNGPIIMDLAALFGLGALVPAGSGFTFDALAVPVPAQHEAAFLGGLTYLNFHTAAFPGGEIRGQIFPDNVFVLASGTATGTGGISNIENATGGSGADSLVGDNNANVISGGGGNDTIVGARGNDTMNGDANNDDIVWSNGDNDDIIDGGADTDNVSINGAVTAGDVFTIGNGTPGRIAFARTNLVAFNLDIGTNETLLVNGVGGDDIMTVNSLSAVTNLTALRLSGFAGSDTFSVIPDANVTMTVHGYDPVSPVVPGDTLTIDAQTNSLTATATAAAIPVSTVTVAGRAPVNFLSIETPTVSNVTSVVVNGTGVNDTLTLQKDLGGNTVYILNGGAPVNINSASSFTFNGSTGNDTFTMDYTNGSPMPTGGVIYNGGENVGDDDRIVVTGYSTVGTVTVAHTGPESGTVQIGSGTPLIAFNETEPLALGGTAVNLIINLPGTGSTSQLSDDGTLSNGILRLSSSPIAFEVTDFTAPTGSLTINRGNAIDTLIVNNLSDFNAASNLNIGSAGNNFQSVTLGGPVTVSALNAFASGIVSGTGATDITATSLVTLSAGSVGIGATGNPLVINSPSLTTDSASGNGPQFLSIVGTTTVTANDLSAGSATITLNAGRLNTTSSGGDILSNLVVEGATSTLAGFGSVNGTVTVNASGTVSPGTSPGIINSGNATFNVGSNFVVEVNGPSVGTQYDQLNVTGAVAINNATLNASGSIASAANLTMVIINNDGSDPVSGIFNGLPEGSTVVINSINFKISYVGGSNNNDVVLLSPPQLPPDLQNPGNQTTPNGATNVVVNLIATDPNNDPLTYSATVQSLEFYFDQQLGLTPASLNMYLNWGGLQEKWFNGISYPWYYMTPNGKLFAWLGGALSNDVLIEQFSVDVYNNPQLLANAVNAPPATVSVVGNVLTINPNDNFVGKFYVVAKVEDGFGGMDTEKFSVSVTGQSPDTTPPTITNRSPIPAATITGSTLNLDITFSEAVAGVDATDLVLSGPGSVGAMQGAAINIGGNSWRFPISNLVNGALGVQLAPDANDIEDVTGNDLAATSWSYNVNLSSVPLPPVLNPIADQTLPNGSVNAVINLVAIDPNNDPLTFSATADSIERYLDQTLNLTFSGNEFLNWGGRNEKW